MATITEKRHARTERTVWRVQIRRKGQEPYYRTFPTRTQAESWAASMEKMLATDRAKAEVHKTGKDTPPDYLLTTAWGLARVELLASGLDHEPSEREIAEYVKETLDLRYIARIDSWDAVDDIIARYKWITKRSV